MDRNLKGIDLPLVFMYLIIVLFGILNIYSISFDFAIKQFIWLVLSIIIVSIIFIIPPNFFETFSLLIYVIGIILLILLFPFGTVINGAKSWFKISYISLQPVEIIKIGTTLLLGRLMNIENYNFNTIKSKIQVFSILFLPIILVLLQPDFGSVLVFFSFFIVLYREGLSGLFFFIGAYFLFLFLFSIYNIFDTLFFLIFFLFILILYFLQKKLLRNLIYFLLLVLFFSVNFYFLFTYFFLNTVILFFLELLILFFIVFYYSKNSKKSYFLLFFIFIFSIFIIFFSEIIFECFPNHQKNRISLLFEGETKYRNTIGYNLLYSKTSIGSGGWFGKGFNCGTITDGKFVPEQHTDYILSVVGEEWGFLGTSLLLIFYSCFIVRIYFIAEKQTVIFNRVVGYSIGSIFLVHFIINVGMVIGMIPTIGIPLPYFSYGGSSLLSFSIMLFIFLRLNYFDKRI